MRRRRLATAAALGLAGVGLRAAGARRRAGGSPPAEPVETPPAPIVRRRVRTEAPTERPPTAAQAPSEPARPPAPAPSSAAAPPWPAPPPPAPSSTSAAPVREAPPRAADLLLLPRPAPFPVSRALPVRAADVLLMPPPAPTARPRPRVTGPRLVAFAAIALLALAALAVGGPRGGGRRAVATTAATGTVAPAAPRTGAPSAPVLATPAAVALRPFPAQSCRFFIPAAGWQVIWADLQQGETVHSEAGGPNDARIACDAAAPGPPIAAAKKAAADARLRAGYRGLALVGDAASALLIYEYDEPGLGRIRVEARFLRDGASLTASAPVARFAALAPVLEAVLASHGAAGT